MEYLVLLCTSSKVVILNTAHSNPMSKHFAREMWVQLLWPFVPQLHDFCDLGCRPNRVKHVTTLRIVVCSIFLFRSTLGFFMKAQSDWETSIFVFHMSFKFALGETRSRAENLLSRQISLRPEFPALPRACSGEHGVDITRPAARCDPELSTFGSVSCGDVSVLLVAGNILIVKEDYAWMVFFFVCSVYTIKRSRFNI